MLRDNICKNIRQRTSFKWVLRADILKRVLSGERVCRGGRGVAVGVGERVLRLERVIINAGDRTEATRAADRTATRLCNQKI